MPLKSYIFALFGVFKRSQFEFEFSLRVHYLIPPGGSDGL